MSTRIQETTTLETRRLLDLGGYVETMARTDLKVDDAHSAFFFPDQLASVAPAVDPKGFNLVAIVPDSGHDDDGLVPVLDPILGIDTDLFPIYGTEGDDEIYGNANGNIIDALGGNDEVYGGGGHDNIDLGAGDDYAQGQAGNDWIRGGDGNDAIIGDFGGDATFLDGNDFLDGGAGNDILYGGGGNDQLLGGTGTDFLSGEDGNDLLIGGAGGADDMYGGAGADSFVSADNGQTHNVWDYSAAEGDMVEGDSWTYNAGTNITTVHLDNGSTPFLLHGYNANVSGINLIEWNPEPAA